MILLLVAILMLIASVVLFILGCLILGPFPFAEMVQILEADAPVGRMDDVDDDMWSV